MPERDFNGVELARTGTFRAVTGRVTFTRKDFDDMAQASSALKGKLDPPLKLGHNDKQKLLEEDGLPAAGWIENVRRIGNLLVADFKRVPEKIADLIESGGLRKRSIEAVRNGEFAGRRYPFVLTAVALLGEDLPAVDSLDDVAALYTAAEMDLPNSDDAEAEVLVVAASESDIESLIDDINRIMERVDGAIRNRRGVPQLRSLMTTAIAELRRVAKVTTGHQTEDDDMDLEKLGKLLGVEATEEAIEAKIGDILGALKKAEDAKAAQGDGDQSKVDEAIAAQADKIAELQKTVITITSDSAKDKATLKVDEAIKAKRFVPAVRDQLIEMALSSREAFDKLVAGTPENTILSSKEAGSSDAGDDWKTRYALSDDEKSIAAQTGLSEEDVIRSKAQEDGVKVPVAAAAKTK